MTARILDGQKIRDEILAELKDEVRLLTAAGIRPGLAAVLVGENPASQLYVKSKIAACEQVDLASALLTPPATVTTLELLAVVEDLNRDNNVDGILVQLPLPPQVDTKRILEAVDPAKDVDGFHPVNLGRLASGRPGLVACTPAGCLEILRRSGILIDVGTNTIKDAAEAERLLHNFPARLEKFRAKGSVLVGDVHPDAVNTAGALTPVPGGVGPMTITMLMSNTVKAARLRRASLRISPTQSTATAR